MKLVAGENPEKRELRRILELPLVPMPDAEDVEIFCFDVMRAEAFEDGERLWPTQVAAVQAYQRTGGGLFPIGVGWGKTGISMMIAQAAYAAGRRKILLLVPPQLVPGLAKRHLPEWRRRVELTVPFHFIAGRGKNARGNIANSDAPGVYVFPYSLVSAQDAIELLGAIRPELVIADEAHNLKNKRSARTKRLLHFLEELDPRPQLVAMSGTITAKSIADYHHLATLALPETCPLPRLASTAFFWGQILNSDAMEPTGHGKAVMAPLVKWAAQNFPQEHFRGDQTESYRRAYRHRLVTAPGVVATGDEEIGVSLAIENISAGEPGIELLEKIRQVQEEMITPQGEPIDHAIHSFRWVYELSGGFYNSLIWPEIADLARTRRISEEEAELLILRAKEHLAALQNYHRELREFFKDSPLGLDTPRDVGLSISRYGDKFVGTHLASLWQAVKDADFEGRPERLSRAVRIDDYKIKAIVKWARERERGGLIWVYHQEMGKWITEALAEADVPAIYCPAGADDEIEQAGDPGRGGKGEVVCVASMPAHGTGRNLQAFTDQLFAQWPRSAVLAEQTLGRTHRNGQLADALVANTLLSIPFDDVCRAACLNDAIYIQQTTGARQKIVYADYDPLPQIFSPEFLREQGTAPEMLRPEHRKVLRQLFGEESA